MAAPPPNELLQWLADNQFLPEPQVEELRAQLPAFADEHALVKELIRRNWLTPYQANQILTDKRQNLVMGQYRLLERIGEGAMGQVLKAWDVRLGRFVAVKRIHKDYLASAKAMDRFRQEMEAAARLHHPHIVMLRNAGEADIGPFMVMDFFEGTNLSQLVKSEGPLPIQLACECVRQAALGLQHAFESGVVHRDIKPGNLLVHRGGPNDAVTVKILDFGLARSVDDRDESRLTQVGRIIGTIDFVSPEQVENAQKADVRSDIYSLGCTLFYLLTAKPPFPGTKVDEKIYGRLLGVVPKLSQERPEAPAGLVAVLERMMARNPEQRYQTPAELAEALQPFTVAPVRTAHLPTAQPVIPLAQPVAGTVPKNLPVARPVLADSAPAQQPNFAGFDPGPPAPADSAFSFRDDAPAPTAAETHDDLFGFGGPPTAGNVATAPASHGFAQPPATTSRPPGSGSSLSRIWLAAGIALTVVLVALTIGVLRGPRAKKASYPGGSLRLVAPASLEMKEGERRLVIVKIQRRGFQGPVKIAVKNLPEGVSAGSATIAEQSERGEVPITVAYRAGAQSATLTLIASADELSTEETLQLTVASARSHP